MGVIYRGGSLIGGDAVSSLSAAAGRFLLPEVAMRQSLSIWPQQIVRDNLVLHYDAAVPESYSGSGTSVADLSGQSNTGTLTNGATFSGNVAGGTFTFDGVDDFIATSYDGPNSLMANSGGSWSVEVWFNFIPATTVPASYGLVGRGGGTGTGATFALGVVGTSTWGGVTRTTNSLCVLLRGTSTPITVSALTSNVWRHVVVTWDGSTARSYLGGSGGGTLSVGSATVQTAFVQVGRIAASGGFNNHISNVKIYSAALTAAQVSQNFNALRNRYGI